MPEKMFSTTETFEQMKAKTVELFDDEKRFIPETMWVGELMTEFIGGNDGDQGLVGVVFGVRTLTGTEHEFYMARQPMAALAAMMFIKAMDDHECDLVMCGVDVLLMGMQSYLHILGIENDDHE